MYKNVFLYIHELCFKHSKLSKFVHDHFPNTDGSKFFHQACLSKNFSIEKYWDHVAFFAVILLNVARHVSKFFNVPNFFYVIQKNNKIWSKTIFYILFITCLMPLRQLIFFLVLADPDLYPNLQPDFELPPVLSFKIFLCPKLLAMFVIKTTKPMIKKLICYFNYYLSNAAAAANLFSCVS